jgi:hypothetical protein
MLIVCTRDETFREYAVSRESRAAEWGDVVLLNGTRRTADRQLSALLPDVEGALCLAGHGNDTTIGDPESESRDWGWTMEEIAEMLKHGRTKKLTGPILLKTCGRTVANGSAHLAGFLHEKSLRGVWCYGYNGKTPIKIPYPAPSIPVLDRQADLQHTES